MSLFKKVNSKLDNDRLPDNVIVQVDYLSFMLTFFEYM